MWNTTFPNEFYDGIEGSRLIKISAVTIPAGAYPVACFGTGFIVFLFVTWHLFNDMSTHFALERDLMFNLPYEIVFQGANLMLNRRRKDRSVKTDNREGQTDPYIFICTTLWQENKIEMETLLRSLVRLSSHLGRVLSFDAIDLILNNLDDFLQNHENLIKLENSCQHVKRKLKRSAKLISMKKRSSIQIYVI